MAASQAHVVRKEKHSLKHSPTQPYTAPRIQPDPSNKRTFQKPITVHSPSHIPPLKKAAWLRRMARSLEVANEIQGIVEIMSRDPLVVFIAVA